MKLKNLFNGILIFLSGLGLAQNSGMESKSIQTNFTKASIKAFQENSQHKLNEFYEYLNLYSKEKNEELKLQIKKNILHLAQADIEIQDFMDNKSNLIDLDSFLSKIENKSYHFEIISASKPIDLGINQWINPYRLKVTQNGKALEFDLKQIIYFEPKQKQFGSHSKSVWELKLGNQKSEF